MPLPEDKKDASSQHLFCISLTLLLFLIFSDAAAAAAVGHGGSSPPSPSVGLIHSQCQLTHYYDHCVSSLLSYRGISNVVYEDMGKLVVDIFFDSTNDTRQQFNKMVRGGFDSASKRALRACGKHYYLAIYNLKLAEKYMKSAGFKKTHDYNSVFRWVYNAEGYFNKCGEILKRLRGLGRPLKQRNEIVMRLGDNAYRILKWLIV